MVQCYCSECKETFDISEMPAWDSPCPKCGATYTWWLMPDIENSEPVML